MGRSISLTVPACLAGPNKVRWVASPSVSKLIFEGLKTGKKTFQFIVCRKTPVSKKLLNTNMKVSLEDYKISEDAKNGFDFKVKFNLKQYRDYGTKTVNIKIAASKPKASAEPKRETNNSPAPAAAQKSQRARSLCESRKQLSDA